jgi:acyl-CoA reductase-like NAD-dependent aldehyde dehydrogenase
MGHTLPASPETLIYLQREPVGVVAIITPWNLPLLMIFQKLGPALALGNTCVIKPPSINSLTALKLAEIIEKLELPPGTVNVITGPGGTVGEALAAHHDVDMVAFTGSSETGKAIMSLASGTVKRLQLELGGKNPAIILDDADVNAAANAMAKQQTNNSGQICGSPGRFYVHEKVYDEFLEKFTVAMKKFVMGDPLDPKTELGPLVSAQHRDRVEGYIQSAIDEGAKVILGGKRPTTPPMNKGYYVLPTIITGITPKMKVAREEIFGPVACFMQPFKSDEEVIALANDNVYGLTSWVWTTDMARGMRFANQIQAGTVGLGQGRGGGGPEFPWGGFKESGIGKEGSLYGMLEFTNLKRIAVDLVTPKKSV